MRFRRPATMTCALALTAVFAVVAPAFSLVIPERPGRFDDLVIPDPSEGVSVAPLPLESSVVPHAVGAGWKAWLSEHGKKGSVVLDGRSGAPLYVETAGIPWITGGRITAEEGRVSAAGPEPVTLDTLAASLRTLVSRNSELLRAHPSEMVLNREGSGQLTPDLWQVQFEREVGGIPVLGDRYIFYIGHGNLSAFGAARWSHVAAQAVPVLTAGDALARLLEYMGLSEDDRVGVIEAGTLLHVPGASEGTPSEAFSGPVGRGYQSALAYRVVLSVEGEAETWVSLVDAISGRILAFYDDTRYARIKGGVYPVSNDGICPGGCEQSGYPLPFAAMTVNGSPVTASSAGTFSCTGGTASSSLSGQYVNVVDGCGAVSRSVACSADLDFSASGGTDCTVPSGSSAGNTHAARTSFYHLNRIKEHARAWLPSNTWLASNLTDNVNIVNSCNAYWSSGGLTGTVNFYRSGGVCRNTGEIAGIFLHEWGHGMDQNDGGGYDVPTEGYADVTALLSTHSSCIGRGFKSTNCSGYGNACLSCTGVRDQDWDQRANHAPSTPAGFVTTNCPAGTSGVCANKAGHCTSYVVGETIWDLAVRDLPAAGFDQNTAWQIVDRLWYKSRTGSGGDAFTCTLPMSNGCGATSWFNKLRAIDDDDGNLSNGTPHAAAIFAAFSRHVIACNSAGSASNQSTTICPAIGTPVLTAVPGAGGSASLSWTAVPNASTYNVLRTDQGCSSGFTIVASAAGTSYSDTGLALGFPESYSVQAVGSNSSCLGALALCQSVTPVAGADLSLTETDGPDPVTAGQSITYSLTATNAGPDAAASAQMSTSTPAGTTYQSLGVPPGWGCSTPSIGGTGAISCTRPSFGASTSAIFTLVVKVDSCVGNGTTVAAASSVSSTSPDPSFLNNSASAATGVNDPGTCSDGNACTIGDACSSGACQSGAPVVCAPSDPCHDAGACDAGTGLCSNPAKPDGSACSDGNACTIGDACQSGACQLGAPAPPPNEVNDTVMVTGPGPSATISWTDAPGPFNVYRGVRGDLPWAYNQVCLASHVPGPVIDASLPDAGATYVYLVSQADPTCGTESIAGRNSAGVPDPNPNPCQ